MRASDLETVSIARPGADTFADLLGRASVKREDVRDFAILGVNIHDVTHADAIALMRAAAQDGVRRSLFIVNAHTLNHAHRSRAYRAILNEADLVFNDGTGVRLAARLQGIRLKANLNGTDLVPAFMRATNGDGLRYFLLGAGPDVLERTVAVTRRDFPGWALAGCHHGFLDGVASERVVAQINAARPHLLLVGMGNPLQERWIHDHRDRIEAGLCIGVGGLFSYLSGDYRRAPLVLRRLGLEWMAIIVLQRQKWRRYVVGNPLFLARIARHAIAGRRR